MRTSKIALVGIAVTIMILCASQVAFPINNLRCGTVQCNFRGTRCEKVYNGWQWSYSCKYIVTHDYAKCRTPSEGWNCSDTSGEQCEEVYLTILPVGGTCDLGSTYCATKTIPDAMEGDLRYTCTDNSP
jgi:hypothetical protein